MEDQSHQNQEKSIRRRKNRKERIRLIPIWLRLLIVFLLLLLSFIAGLMFGFGVIGEGKPLDVLNPKIWTHIYDLISGKE